MSPAAFQVISARHLAIGPAPGPITIISRCFLMLLVQAETIDCQVIISLGTNMEASSGRNSLDKMIHRSHMYFGIMHRTTRISSKTPQALFANVSRRSFRRSRVTPHPNVPDPCQIVNSLHYTPDPPNHTQPE
ncbi:hypothetical protein F4782DRAFT_457278 [Xylaria castorea]|nr:hypothetical protein F4782DRAFT_457278 [Xylaria castorea]